MHNLSDKYMNFMQKNRTKTKLKQDLGGQVRHVSKRNLNIDVDLIN